MSQSHKYCFARLRDCKAFKEVYIYHHNYSLSFRNQCIGVLLIGLDLP